MDFETFRIGSGSARVAIIPARGALVTELEVSGREVLFLDRDSLADPKKNVRGGIPILFPFAGRLPEGGLLPDGSTMPQHGFGRNRAWEVTGSAPDSLAMSLASDDATRANFTYDFECEHRVTALPRGLELRLAVTNTGTRAMPIAPGWHPYFNCPTTSKEGVSAEAPAVPAGSLYDGGEPDFGVPAPSGGVATYDVPGLGALTLRMSPELRHLQMWSLPGRPFVCIEPFWGPAGSINDGRRGVVEPGATCVVWARIELGG